MARKATKQSKYDWKRWSALQLVSWLPKDSREAFEIHDWMIHSAYGVAAQLPAKPKEALAVLALVRELVEKRPLQHRLRKAAKPRGKAAS
jgi:hypothetical protein